MNSSLISTMQNSSTKPNELLTDDGWRFVHERSISVRCEEHADGRIRAVGELLDEKGIPIVTYSGKVIGSGGAMHRMQVSLVVSSELVIEAVGVEMLDVPGEICPRIRSAYQSLCGVAISKGFSRTVVEKLGGISGCTHLTGLILQMGPVIMQAYFSRFLAPDQLLSERHALIAQLDGSCHVFNSTDGSQFTSNEVPLSGR